MGLMSDLLLKLTYKLHQKQMLLYFVFKLRLRQKYFLYMSKKYPLKALSANLLHFYLTGYFKTR